MGALIAPVIKFVASITLKQALVGLAVYAGINYTVKAAMKKGAGDNMGGLTISRKDPAAPRKLLYGESRVGGTIVWSKTAGDKNEYLYQVFALGDSSRLSPQGGIVGMAPAINDGYAIYFDNVLKAYLSNGSWVYPDDLNADDISIQFFDGTQTAPPSLLLEANQPFNSTHKFAGIGGAVVKLKYDQKKFPTGLPVISFRVSGRLVYDPRKDSTSDAYDSDLGVSTHRPTNASTWEYSENPALCLLDYMRDQLFGIEFNIDRYDVETVGLAATVCDQNVLLSNGLTEKRYTLNGVVNSANSIIDNIEDMLTSMAGRIYYSEGKYKIFSSNYRAPLQSGYDITEDMIVGEVELLTAASKKDLYNRVQGKYRDKINNYVIASYPTQTNPAFAASDNNEVLALDLDLPFTDSHTTAQRIAKYTLYRSRNMRTIQLKVNMKGFQYCVGDIVNIHFDKFSYTPKAFEIQNIKLVIDPKQGMVVELTALEDSPTSFDWDEANDELAHQNIISITNYDGKSVSAPDTIFGEFSVVSDDDGNGTPKLSIQIEDEPDAFVTHYQLFIYRLPFSGATGHEEFLTDAQEFTLNRDFADRRTHMVDIVDRRVGAYRIAVQAVNINGIFSDVTATDFIITDEDRLRILPPPQGGLIIVQQFGALTTPTVQQIEAAKGSPVAEFDQIIYQQINSAGEVLDSKIYVFQAEAKILHIFNRFQSSSPAHRQGASRCFVDVMVEVTAAQGGTWDFDVTYTAAQLKAFHNTGLYAEALPASGTAPVKVDIYSTEAELNSLRGQTTDGELIYSNTFIDQNKIKMQQSSTQRALFRFEIKQNPWMSQTTQIPSQSNIGTLYALFAGVSFKYTLNNIPTETGGRTAIQLYRAGAP